MTDQVSIESNGFMPKKNNLLSLSEFKSFHTMSNPNEVVKADGMNLTVYLFGMKYLSLYSYGS